MKKILVIILALITVFTFVACGKKEGSSSLNKVNINTEKKLTALVEKGNSPYKIVIPENASSCIEYAARELNSFIFQSTDASLPIIKDNDSSITDNKCFISLGKTKLLERANFNFDYQSLNIDGFYIKSKGNIIYIDGDLERGTLYGVYDFLERFLGIRFITSSCTHVPKNEKVYLFETEIKQVPDFAGRLYLDIDTYHHYGSQSFVARSRQDASYLQYNDSQYGEVPTTYARGLRDHNLRYFVDRNVYGEEHPEFYVDPTDEQIQKGISHYTLCLTNGITEQGTLDTAKDTSVAKIVIEEMKKDILSNPNCSYFVIEQEDGQIYCECEKCKSEAKKYKRSGILVRFLNLVSRELQKWCKEQGITREINIQTFAYSYTLQAPVDGNGNPLDKSVIADDNVVIRIAFAYNMLYNYSSEKQATDLKNSLKNWSVCASKFFFWVHDKDFADYLSYAPSIKHIKQNVLDMKEFGVKSVMIQGSQNGYNDWQALLRGYVYRNLLWDSSLDENQLIDEFLTYYFSESAKPFVEDLINSYNYNYDFACKNDPNLIIYSSQTAYKNPTYGTISLNFLNNMIKKIEDAEKCVNENEDYSYSEKQEYLKRLASVKATPYGTIHKHYRWFYPTATKDEQYDFYKYFYELIDYAGLVNEAETVSFATVKARNGF